jgi:outer membrane protein assembly factor BamA
VGKMKKLFEFLLFFILIIILTISVTAQNIEEIKIIGLKRSREELLLKQLPYKNEDIYSNQKLELSQKRLLNSDLFNPFTLKVSNIKRTNDNFNILINAENSGIFMVHPWEFTIRKTVGLFGENFEQKIRNPHGNGLSYIFALDLSNDSYEQYGLEYVGENGRIYIFNYRNFDSELKFNQKEFQTDGSFYQFDLETIPSAKIKNNYSLKFQENDYNINTITNTQSYLIPAYTLNYNNNFNFELELSRAFSLNDNYDDFNNLKLNFNKTYSLNKSSRIIADFKGGFASEETPFNYQFTAGSFSKNDGGIPIRGQDYKFAGTKYIKRTLEYQKELWRRNLWGVIFIDSAKIAVADKKLGNLDWENDAGLGIIYYSFLGPIRADIAFDNINSKPEFNIGFGSSF